MANAWGRKQNRQVRGGSGNGGAQWDSKMLKCVERNRFRHETPRTGDVSQP